MKKDDLPSINYGFAVFNMKPEYSLLGQNEDLPSTDVPFSTSLGKTQ